MNVEELRSFARRALDEDVGSGDITTEAIVPANARARGVVVQKQEGVVFGYAVARAVFTELDPSIEWRELEPEGCWRNPSCDLVEIVGSAGALLTGERVALNFLQHLSGVATLTARYVRAVEASGAKILDTRKTIPGLRLLEKQAVRAGGGSNHRIGLYDAVLIKDNHIEIAGGIKAAVARVKEKSTEYRSVEIECETLAQVEEALAAGSDRILLDNMSVGQIQAAKKLASGRAELEVSGGVTLDRVGEIASESVEYISVGALTHSAPALDLSLEIQVI